MIQNWLPRSADVRCLLLGGSIVGKGDSIGHVIDLLGVRMPELVVVHLLDDFPFLRVLFGDFQLHFQVRDIGYGLRNMRNFPLKQAK